MAIGQILFVQGGGKGAHQADAGLVASLVAELGSDYEVRYPRMPNEAEPDYAAWKALILDELATMGDSALLVGHSLGASVLLKVLSGIDRQQAISGVFLIACPFWGGDGWQGWAEVELPDDASARLPSPMFLYHSRDDEEVPYAHLELYVEALPQAVARRLSGRNHQLNDDLSEVAADIKRLG